MSNNKNDFLNTQSVRPSFYEVLDEIKQQIDYESLITQDSSLTALYTDVSKIMTEVMFLNNTLEIKIAGDVLPGQLIKDIYRQITTEHVELVIDNFLKIKSKIKNKKAYLRSALYNSVFEMESHYTNQVSHDLHN